MLGELRNGHDALEPLDGRGRLLALLGVEQEVRGVEQQRRHHQVRQRQLVADQVLPAVPDGGLDLAQGAPEGGGGGVVGLGAVGLEPEEGQEPRVDVREHLGLAEERPLGDLGLGLGVGAEQLRGAAARGGDVGGDGGALGEAEAVGALEAGDLAEGELGKELGLLAFDPKLEPVGARDVDLQTAQVGDDLDLMEISMAGPGQLDEESDTYALHPRVVRVGVDGAEGSHDV